MSEEAAGSLSSNEEMVGSLCKYEEANTSDHRLSDQIKSLIKLHKLGKNNSPLDSCSREESDSSELKPSFNFTVYTDLSVQIMLKHQFMFLINAQLEVSRRTLSLMNQKLTISKRQASE